MSSNDRKEFIDGISYSFIVRGVGAILALFTSIILARLLGPESYGIYAFCLALVTLLAIPAQFGAGTVLIRFCASYEKQKQWGLIKGLLRWANTIVLAGSFALAICAAIFLTIFNRLVPDGSHLTLAIALVLLPFYALGELRAAALNGLRHFIKAQLPEAIIRPAGLLIIIGVLSVLDITRNWNASSVMAVQLVATVIAFVVGAYWLLNALPINLAQHSAKTATNEWLKSMGVLTLTRGGRIALMRMDIIFVGIIAGPESAGIYRVATALSSVVSFGLNIVNTIVAPYFSRMHVTREHDRIIRTIKLTCAFATIFALPLVILLVLYGKTIISILYNEEYNAAYIPLVILCLGQLINSIAGSVGVLTNMTGQERWALVAVCCALIAAVPGYLFIVPQYSYTGAAAVSASALILLNSILVIRILYWLNTK